MNNKKQYSYAQLIQQLKDFCNNNRSGTMLIISSDSHSIRFVLESGIIIACAYTMTQGKDALLQIRKIQSGSFSFVDGGFTGGMNINESPLPDTDTIFRVLSQGIDINEGMTVNTPAFPSPSPQASALGSLNFNQAIKDIEGELAEFLGPMAEFIFEEAIEDLGFPRSPNDLANLVKAVASEIDNPAEKETFKQNSVNIINS